MSLAIAMTVPMATFYRIVGDEARATASTKHPATPSRPADSFRHFVASKRAKYQRCHSCQSQSDCEQTSKGWSGNLLATFFQHGGGDGGFARLLADGLPKLQSDGLCSFARSALLRNGESTAKARRMPFFNKMMKIERLIEKRMKMI